MATTTRPLVGVFLNEDDAREAVSELRRADFDAERIGVLGAAREEVSTARTATDPTYAAQGAGTGLVGGAVAGGLWAIGISAGLLPAIGPVIAGGMLASVLASSAIGAATGGVLGALIGLGVPENDAQHYEQHVREGRTIVTVDPGLRVDEAGKILSRHHLLRIDRDSPNATPPLSTRM